MSKSSIYETAWIDLVFEGKNKEYGAYQLRQENSRTTVKALFLALALLTALATISLALSSTGTSEAPPIIDTLGPTVNMDDILQPEQPKQPEKVTALPPVKPDEPKPVFKDPEIVTSAKATPETPSNTDFPGSSSLSSGTTPGTGTDAAPATGGPAINTTGGAESGTTLFIPAALDKKPAFPGGMDRFYTYVGRNFKTPEDIIESGKMVKVMVSFVIEKDGTMTDIKVMRNPGFGLDKEAIRVLQSMKTKWEPGIFNGKPVRVAYNLPITVKAP